MIKRKPILGLALGSGSACCAHIGVLCALEAQGIVPDIVCGCSIGAFAGAAYVNGDFDKLEAWVSQLDWKDVVGLFDVGFNGGLVNPVPVSLCRALGADVVIAVSLGSERMWPAILHALES